MATVQALPLSVRIFIVDTLIDIAIVQAFQPGTTLSLDPNIPQEMMVAAARALQPGTTLCLHPSTAQDKMVAAARALQPGTRLIQRPKSKEDWQSYLHFLMLGMSETQNMKQKQLNKTPNCAYIAMRLLAFLKSGYQKLDPVPNKSADLETMPQYNDGGYISRSLCDDSRLVELISKGQSTSTYREQIDCSTGHTATTIDSESKASQDTVRFYRAEPKNIIEQLKLLPRDARGNAYGFVLYTSLVEKSPGHIANFLVDNEHNVYFLDGQGPKTTWVSEQPATLTHDYRDEIFYINAAPEDGFKVKQETDVSMNSPLKRKPSSESVMVVNKEPGLFTSVDSKGEEQGLKREKVAPLHLGNTDPSSAQPR